MPLGETASFLAQEKPDNHESKTLSLMHYLLPVQFSAALRTRIKKKRSLDFSSGNVFLRKEHEGVEEKLELPRIMQEMRVMKNIIWGNRKMFSPHSVKSQIWSKLVKQLNAMQVKGCLFESAALLVVLHLCPKGKWTYACSGSTLIQWATLFF